MNAMLGFAPGSPPNMNSDIHLIHGFIFLDLLPREVHMPKV